VELSGGGVAPITASSTLAFGKVARGTTVTKPLTVTNPANNPELTGLSMSFSGSGDFYRSSADPGSCSTTLAGGSTAQSCTINVVFAPGSGEAKGAIATGTISISGAQGPVPQSKTIPLTGTVN
jgi:hypothetical protein